MKNSIKKLLILLVFVILCLGVSACSCNPYSSNSNEDASGSDKPIERTLSFESFYVDVGDYLPSSIGHKPFTLLLVGVEQVFSENGRTPGLIDDGEV